MEKEGFIYIWFDRKRKMYYIGCHWGTVDDGYICSSKWMRDAYRYRPHDFKKRIIKKGIKRKELLSEEYKWLQLIKQEDIGTRYYNLHTKHFGHWSTVESFNFTVRQKLSEASKKLHQDPVYKKKFFEGRKNMPPQTQEQIDKRSKANTGKKRTQETKRKISDAHKGKVMGSLSDETRAKLSIALTGDKNPFYGKTHDPGLKKQMSRKASATMKGKMPANIPTGYWWNNGTINKRSPEIPGSEWCRGRMNKTIFTAVGG
jgi:hypothetical protein